MKNINIGRFFTLRGLPALVVAFALSMAIAAAPALADDEYLRDGDIPLGAEDAPITIVEYASMTCPHCASFHQNTWPQLESEYIDTGKVRFIFREFPLDQMALRASMVARCAGPEMFYGFLKVLFKQQLSWVRATDPVAALGLIAKGGGMKTAVFEQCMSDRELSRSIIATRYYGSNELGVNSTPTFFINGEVFPGDIRFPDLDEVLKRILEG